MLCPVIPGKIMPVRVLGYHEMSLVPSTLCCNMQAVSPWMPPEFYMVALAISNHARCQHPPNTKQMDGVGRFYLVPFILIFCIIIQPTYTKVNNIFDIHFLEVQKQNSLIGIYNTNRVMHNFSQSYVTSPEARQSLEHHNFSDFFWETKR